VRSLTPNAHAVSATVHRSCTIRSTRHTRPVNPSRAFLWLFTRSSGSCLVVASATPACTDYDRVNTPPIPEQRVRYSHLVRAALRCGSDDSRSQCVACKSLLLRESEINALGYQPRLASYDRRNLAHDGFDSLRFLTPASFQHDTLG
jgi:hypothetical protein